MIQDDAVVCRNFAGAVDAISYSNPNTPVCLFLAGFPQGTARMFMRALQRKHSYVDLLRSPIVPLIAVLWPKHKAEEFLEWADAHKLPGHPNPRADDGIAGKWFRDTGQHIRCTVPCLVEHPDIVPSVKGGISAGGKPNRMRSAVVFAEDGLAYDW